MSKSLADLIDAAATAYGVAPLAVALANRLDPRGLAHFADVAGQSAARLAPIDLHEVSKWRMARGLSRYPEIRALA